MLTCPLLRIYTAVLSIVFVSETDVQSCLVAVDKLDLWAAVAKTKPFKYIWPFISKQFLDNGQHIKLALHISVSLLGTVPCKRSCTWACTSINTMQDPHLRGSMSTGSFLDCPLVEPAGGRRELWQSICTRRTTPVCFTTSLPESEW